MSLAEPGALERATQARDVLTTYLNMIKQNVFYTHCVAGNAGKAIFTEPVQRITEMQARALVECAVMSVPRANVKCGKLSFSSSISTLLKMELASSRAGLTGSRPWSPRDSCRVLVRI
jgi:hypothetical protein